MTSIIVSHEIADVDVVLLRFRGNGAPFAVPLSARQAKRLAWGILADLDPEEAAEVAAESRRLQPARIQRLSAAHKRSRYLAAIAERPKTATDVAFELGSSRGRVNSEMAKLLVEGLVYREDCRNGRYGISGEGRRILDGAIR